MTVDLSEGAFEIRAWPTGGRGIQIVLACKGCAHLMCGWVSDFQATAPLAEIMEAVNVHIGQCDILRDLPEVKL